MLANSHNTRSVLQGTIGHIRAIVAFITFASHFNSNDVRIVSFYSNLKYYSLFLLIHNYITRIT